MDFADFDLRAVSEAGTWVHLEHSGRALYAQEDNSIGAEKTDRPSRIHLRGIMAPGVMDNIRAAQRISEAYEVRMQRARDKEIDGLVEKREAQMQEVMRKLVVAAVSKWENIIIAGKDAELTEANVLRVCGPGTAFFEQVNAAIMEKHDFFKSAAQG